MILDRFIPRAAPAPDLDGRTIVDVLRSAARARGDAVALRWHDDGGWRTLSWTEYERAVHEVAGGLVAAGLRPGDRVGILSANRPEWHIVDLAVLAAGLVSVPVYATASSSQVAHILRDSGCRWCFVEDGHQLAKVLLRRAELPALEATVVLETLDGADDRFVHHLGDLRSTGSAAAVVPRLPEDVATLVYTSGTTGPPKGAVITHANIMATLRSLAGLVALAPSDRFLSFLPLSHITERSVSHFGLLASGGETWFARGLATLADDLRACRPTLFFAVPRVWEKFREAVIEHASAAPRPLRAAVGRYLDLATQRAAGTDGRGRRAAFGALDVTVGAALRRRLGLDRARLLTCGAAPVHPDVLRWFAAIGLPVAEGYGQTEVTMCTTLNPGDAIRIGTVGRPIPGVEVRIGEGDEILVKGPGVCAGYWQQPEATAALVDVDGWLHTGDLGRLDPDGYLTVTGRAKDLIVTAYGKNISPTEIETALGFEPLVAHAVVVGDRRPYLTALLTVDPRAAQAWAEGEGRTLELEALCDDADLRRALDAAIERVNGQHSHAEGIRRWRLLPRDLTVEAGELTPTLKVKRQVVEAEFEDLVAEMYADATS